MLVYQCQQYRSTEKIVEDGTARNGLIGMSMGSNGNEGKGEQFHHLWI